MRDPRLQTLAKNLVHYSIRLQSGEKVFIEMIGSERELVKCIVEEVYKIGGYPFVELSDRSVLGSLLIGANEDQIKHWAMLDMKRMDSMDAYIGIRAGENMNELAGVPAAKMKLYDKFYKNPVHTERRVKHTKWVVLRYPNASMAQSASMSTAAFENFYFDVCNLDYSHMSKAMDPLVELMNKTDKVRIVAPETDITFSIKGIPAVKCAGELNIPDGEVFTAPVRDSVNGTILYNTPSVYSGITFDQIRFRFEHGKIVEATSNDSKRLNEILDVDDGARYIGEFSMGFNPYIKQPIKDILFDEKIDGSLHFTPGQAYDQADNHNRSSVHWDLVLIQRADFGGGEIYFDDVLIRKDGRFVLEKLDGLNPENLK